MYTGFYELSQEPFHVTPDPDFLFPSPAHKEALAAIVYGIEQRKGFVAITGEVGVGKTTILRSYLDLADRKNLKLIYIYNSDLTFDELLVTLFQELGIPDKPPTTFLAVTRLHEELIEIYRKNATVVLIIDEAQNMPVETLESLRMLSNLETVTEKLIQIMLIGQPEFDEMLQQHRLRQLRQRIAIHARIDPLTIEDSLAYLEHRLQKVALSSKPVFTKHALRMIAEAAQGIPRSLNILSDNALITGFGYQIRPVNAKIVKEVLTDRRLAPETKRSRRGAWIAGGAAAAIAAAIAAAVFLQPRLIGGRDMQLARSGSTADFAVEPPSGIDRARMWVDRFLGETAGGPTPVESERAPASPPPPELAQQPQPKPQPKPSQGSSAASRPPVIASAPSTAPSATSNGHGGSASTTAPSNAMPPSPPPVATRADPPVAAAPASPRAAETAAAPERQPDATSTANASVPQKPQPEAEPARPASRSGSTDAATTNGAAAPSPSKRASAPPTPPSSPPPSTPSRTTSSAPTPPRQPPAAPPQFAYAVPPPPTLTPPASDASLDTAVRATPEASGGAARSEHFVRTVRFGDNLWTMAEDVYGYVNPNVLRKVQDANPRIRNVNVLTPGQEILFPRSPEALPGRSTDVLSGNPAPLPSTGRN